MAMNPRRIRSADEILDLEIPPGLSGYEFVDGELVPVTPASHEHGRLIIEVGRRLANHVEAAGLPADVASDGGIVLGLPQDRERMRAPDVAYISHARLEGLDPERFVRGAVPEFVIEIDLSSGKKPHGQQRVRDYLAAGVSLVWAIDPHRRTAAAYDADGRVQHYRENDVLDASEVVPGFRLALHELFR